ncbi:hypothetical protein [Brevundimonas poindexterae]|uniref:hypothetical protein n=1 Tax=Brevundimonas poindexterae TaxID=74325 RepID=UPI001CFF000A|nr:hypothetical protein [Brevundimonas poindexterae]
MLNFIAIIAAATSLMSGVQEPGDWRQVDEGPEFFAALDVNSISGPPTARKALGVRVSPQSDGLSGYLIVDLVFNCEALTFGADKITFFALDGTLIEEFDWPSDPAPINEEEGNLGAANAVCDGQMPPGPGFGSAQAYAQSIRASTGS